MRNSNHTKNYQEALSNQTLQILNVCPISNDNNKHWLRVIFIYCADFLNKFTSFGHMNI